jgi:hypothetical protein
MIDNILFNYYEELKSKCGINTRTTSFDEDIKHYYTYINKVINDLLICYTNPTFYCDIYYDLITTNSAGYSPESYTIDAKEDLVAMYLPFDQDKFTINNFLVAFPDKFPKCKRACKSYLSIAGEVIVCGIAWDADDDDDGISGDELTTSDIIGRNGVSVGSSYTRSSKSGSEGRKSVHSFNNASMEYI